MNYSIHVCLYNMGFSILNYQNLYSYWDPRFNKDLTILNNYETVQKTAADVLLGGNSHVYCLHEVGSTERPLINELIRRKFTIIHSKKNPSIDNVIAIHLDHFQDIRNHSCVVSLPSKQEQDVAIAVATNSSTHQRVVFVSACFPADLDSRKSYWSKILDKLLEIKNWHLQVIGAGLHDNDYSIFMQKDFQLIRSNKETHVKDRKKKEADFFVVKENCCLATKLQALFMDSFEKGVTYQPKSLLALNPEKNSSDHLPVTVEITFKKKEPSPIARKVIKVIATAAVLFVFYKLIRSS